MGRNPVLLLTEEAGEHPSQEGVSQIVQEGGILPWPNKQHIEGTTVSVGPDASADGPEIPSMNLRLCSCSGGIRDGWMVWSVL